MMFFRLNSDRGTYTGGTDRNAQGSDREVSTTSMIFTILCDLYYRRFTTLIYDRNDSAIVCPVI